MNVLVGSRALAHWRDEFKIHIKSHTDWDVISEEDSDSKLRIERSHPEFLNNGAMAKKYASSEMVTLPDGTNAYVMSMPGLAVMKRSHLWRNLNFDKHITHFHKHGLAQALPMADQEDLRARLELTWQEFKTWRPNLRQSVDKFFDDAVVKVYNHDYLHELYAHEDKPMYYKMQRDHSSAWCEKDIWETFTHQQKINCISEECYVIATERLLVPNQWQYGFRQAYFKALTKVCTTLCSGWFRAYAIDHYPDVVNNYSNEKIQNVKNTLERKC